MEPQEFRSVKLYRDHFETFFKRQKQKVKDKIIWTLRLVEEIRIVPETYLKHLAGTDGLYEIRVQCGSDIFRIFCFFDEGNLVVLMNGFQKKSQKTPIEELAKANKLKSDYYEEKKLCKRP
jgi:phage-related protein